jgi:hypothetical protein
MKKLFLFFCESDGTPSSQRLIFIIGSIFTMIMGVWTFTVTSNYTSVIAIVVSLSGVYGTQKIIQKTLEK